MKPIIYSRRSMIAMWIGVTIAFVCFALRSYGPTSPSTQIDSLTENTAQIRSKVQQIQSSPETERTVLTELSAEIESLSESLTVAERYAWLLSDGQFWGVLIFNIACWTQIIPWWRSNTVPPAIDAASNRS